MKRFTALIALFIIFCCCAHAAGTIVYGNTDEAIKSLQQSLKELEFFTGECDGYFGDETKLALSNFQRANGLSVTGLADLATMEALSTGSCITKSEYVLKIENYAQTELELKSGDSGKNVVKLQNRLKDLGYFTVDTTGNYGSTTAAAVMCFQLVNGLEPTGTADSETISKIASATAVPAGAAGTVLKFGDTGSDVKWLQLKLTETGWFTGDCTSRFGKRTQQAVKEFQKANSLEQTGECGIETCFVLVCGDYVTRDEADDIEYSRELELGDTDEAIAEIKQKLLLLGYYSGETGNEFTLELKTALEEYQQGNGLFVTGSADAVTRRQLDSDDSVNAEEYRQQLKQKRLEDLLELAKACVNLPYEGGKIGPDSFGNAGFVYYCFLNSGVELSPTVTLLLSDAMQNEGWNAYASELGAGELTFVTRNGEYVAGISTENGAFIYASAEYGSVISIANIINAEGYEFVGSIAYIK